MLLGVLTAGAANAKVVTCDDIAAAQTRGLTTDSIRQELRTTSARIENCSRLADMNAQQTARRGVIRARRAARDLDPQ